MNFIYSVAWILACKLKFEDKVIFSETGKRFENQHKITSSRMFFLSHLLYKFLPGSKCHVKRLLG